MNPLCLHRGGRWLAFSRLGLLAVVLGACPDAIWGEPGAGTPAPGMVAIYSGKTVLSQTIGDETSSSPYAAHVMIEGRSPTSVRITRLIDDEAGTKYATTEYFGLQTSPGGYSLSPDDSSPVAHELGEETHGLNIFFPIELLPAFQVPAKGMQLESDAELNVLNAATLKLPFVTTVDSSGRVIERALNAGNGDGEARKFELQENPSKLKSYSARYELHPETGEVESFKRSLAVDVTVDDQTIVLAQTIELKRDTGGALKGATKPSWSSVVDAFDNTLAVFDKRPPSAEIKAAVTAFAAKAKATPVAILSDVLELRLEAFHSFFEATEAGKMLAKVLGRQAPDFKLKDLDGKEVSFKELTKDKPAILSFWGYG